MSEQPVSFETLKKIHRQSRPRHRYEVELASKDAAKARQEKAEERRKKLNELKN